MFSGIFMVKRSLIKIKENEIEGLVSLGKRDVNYSFEDCRDFSDAEIKVIEAINARAPEDAQYYRVVSDGDPSRLAAIKFARASCMSPINFTKTIEFYK